VTNNMCLDLGRGRMCPLLFLELNQRSMSSHVPRLAVPEGRELARAAGRVSRVWLAHMVRQPVVELGRTAGRIVIDEVSRPCFLFGA